MQGKKIQESVIGSEWGQSEETHSMKNISTKSASFKNLTKNLNNNTTSGELQNNVFSVKISFFVEGHCWRHLLYRIEQISPWTSLTKHCFHGPDARMRD